MIADSAFGAAAELDLLLDEPRGEAKLREQTAFDRMLKPSSGRVVIYGAGSLGQRVLAGLRDTGTEVVAFADRNAVLWSQKVGGIRVLSPPEAAKSFGDDDLFIVAVWHPAQSGGIDSLVGSLRSLGCRHVTSFVPLFWRDAARYLPYYLWDLPSSLLDQVDDVRSGFRLFDGDAKSQRVYVQQVRLRLLGDFGCLAPPTKHEQYFPQLFQPIPNESFVDCGAFDGDTIRAFLEWTGGSFRKITAFEPDPRNVDALRQFAQTRPDLAGRLEVRSSALSDRAEMKSFTASGAGNAALSTAGDLQVSCKTLDEELGSERATFLKMDIEGEEIAALRGARQLVARDRPILAICVYHLQNHLWNVPQFMSSMFHRNRLSLISYRIDGFDTVSYAIPEERYIGQRVHDDEND